MSRADLWRRAETAGDSLSPWVDADLPPAERGPVVDGSSAIEIDLEIMRREVRAAAAVLASDPDFMLIGNGDVQGVPYLVLIMLVLLGLSYALMRFTAFGRNLYAVGGDYDVARYSGINVIRTKWMAFVVNMLGIASYYQVLLKGVTIVGIIWLDCFHRKRKREAV